MQPRLRCCLTPILSLNALFCCEGAMQQPRMRGATTLVDDIRLDRPQQPGGGADSRHALVLSGLRDPRLPGARRQRHRCVAVWLSCMLCRVLDPADSIVWHAPTAPRHPATEGCKQAPSPHVCADKVVCPRLVSACSRQLPPRAMTMISDHDHHNDACDRSTARQGGGPVGAVQLRRAAVQPAARRLQARPRQLEQCMMQRDVGMSPDSAARTRHLRDVRPVVVRLLSPAEYTAAPTLA